MTIEEAYNAGFLTGLTDPDDPDFVPKPPTGGEDGMKYGIEVLVGPRGKQTWQRLQPSRGAPYSWATRGEAEAVQRMCYGAPEHSGLSRVLEIER